MKIKSDICLFIFTRDFRIIDNTSLNYIVNEGYKHIIPIFIFTNNQINKNEYFSNNSVQCLCHGLHDINKYLNNNLNIYKGNYPIVLSEILRHTTFSTISINRDITPYGLKRESMLKQWCHENSIKFYTKEDYSLYDLEFICFMIL